MKRTPVAAALLIIAFAAAPVWAQSTDTPRIDKREAKQADRIEQGMNSGALTPGETARLDRGQARIQAGEAAAKADGKVTKRERLALTRAQNHQSRKIYRLKHNARTTTPAA
ncbi:MAG TPA: hypothetical protein VHZ01_08280 [Casimicrobiaceae bacterium]|jgi:hypothetical protein|nr:hypothetical protein [Casimicrobiaceae bacterium]